MTPMIIINEPARLSHTGRSCHFPTNLYMLHNTKTINLVFGLDALVTLMKANSPKERHKYKCCCP